jgi:foldase protein PrsA
MARKKSVPPPEDKAVSENTNKSYRLVSKRNILLAVVLLLILAAWFGRSFYIAATINGSPITRIELNKQLLDRFGEQTLDQLITQKLVEAEIKKQKVVITSAEVDSRVQEIEKTLPQGMSLEEAVKMQGSTLEELRNQLALQMGVNKMLEDRVEVSDAEIDNFIKENSQILTATDAAAQKEEAKAAIKDQKLGELIQSWLEELKNNAKVTKFL